MTNLALNFGQELVVDLFAGAGGASAGIAAAYREPDVAVNHDPIAIGVHQANHASTTHFTCDVFEVDPVLATGGRPVGLLWASPDCRHHSKAKGGKPRNKRVRGLAWVVVRWADRCRPRVIHLENVEEFADWGPLLANGQPCPIRKGLTFRRWKRQLERIGYKVEHRELIAADYGTPTTRKRLYVIARCDGRPIVWPKATHAKGGAGGLKPWRSAAECIDFALPARSIFDRPKPLATNTNRRVAKGVWRFVLNHPRPFIVPLRGTSNAHTSTHDVAAPLSTVSAGGTHHALVTPFLTEHANASTQRVFSAAEPLRTQVAQVKGGHFSLVSPVLIEAAHSDISPSGVKRWGSGVKDLDAPMGTVHAGGGNFALAAAHLTHLTHHDGRAGYSLGEPARTVTAAHRGEQAIVATHITKFRTNSVGSAIEDPMHTVCAGGDMARPAGAAHALGLVSAFMEQANTDMVGHDARAPVSTIVGKGCTQRLISVYMVKFYGEGGQWADIADPMHTVTTKDRMGIVHVESVAAHIIPEELRAKAKRVADFMREYLPEHFTAEADAVMLGDYILTDITLRMLTPRELAWAQGFPESYVLDRLADGTPVTKTNQVRLIGNSVCQQVAEALVRANLAELIRHYDREACIA